MGSPFVYNSYGMTTTTTYTKVRGLSVELLKTLRESPKSTVELCLEFEVKGNFLRPYLHNLKKYALIEKDGASWTIIPEKMDIVDKIININKVKEKVKVSKRRSKIIVKEEPFLRKEKLKKAFDDFFKQKKYEKVVVDVARKLFEHYLETGQKFSLFNASEEMESFFGYSIEDIHKAIIRLTNERVAYKWKKPGELKIALYVDFIKKLKGE
jgi:predicted transcriptional regulator